MFPFPFPLPVAPFPFPLLVAEPATAATVVATLETELAVALDAVLALPAVALPDVP